MWGSAAATGTALEPQRADLWKVDLSDVVNGLNSQNAFGILGLPVVREIYPQLVQSVVLPDIKMKPEVIRRDSVPFQMPSWDEPLDAVKIVFLVDSSDNLNQSLVLSLVQTWQAVVRAGRGDRTLLYNAGVFPLDDNYQANYAFNLRISLLRGSLTTQAPNNVSSTQAWLEIDAEWILSAAWLASWKLSDLNYTESRLMTLEAVLYGEDLYQIGLTA